MLGSLCQGMRNKNKNKRFMEQVHDKRMRNDGSVILFCIKYDTFCHGDTDTLGGKIFQARRIEYEPSISVVEGLVSGNA